MRGPTLPFDFSQKQKPAESPTSSEGSVESSRAEPDPSAHKPEQGPRTLTVGELNRAIKRSLDIAFDAALWVEGEVTGARPATSGHLYFCLNDEREEAALDIVVYRTNVTPRMRKLVVDGARVRLRGRPTFWPPRGRLQFIAERVDLAGRGALLEALEKLKEKLAAEGLFARDKKRPLPREPRIIGVVTSRAGAAMHDVCRVAFRRGGARLLLAPAQVQGAGAAASIVRALQMLQRVRGVDVIVLGRGGGSAEDLVTFNDENVVRAVAYSSVPVVSAIGHEVDVTLTDFAADARAATPSQAAELVVPDSRAAKEELVHTRARLMRGMRGRVADARAELGAFQRRLGDPRLAIASFQQTLDDRTGRLEAAGRESVARRRETVSETRHRLALLHPSRRIAEERAAIQRLDDGLGVAWKRRIARREKMFEGLGARLDAMSPLKVLGRGYAIATRSDGRALRDPGDVEIGERVTIRVRRAHIDADVVGIEEAPGAIERTAPPTKGRGSS